MAPKTQRLTLPRRQIPLRQLTLNQLKVEVVLFGGLLEFLLLLVLAVDSGTTRRRDKTLMKEEIKICTPNSLIKRPLSEIKDDKF